MSNIVNFQKYFKTFKGSSRQSILYQNALEMYKGYDF